jgi:HAD superfamily hydrolase (TIGR01509 family)
MPYDAVIFDLDGTLVDTEALAMAAGQTAADRHGWAWSEAFFQSLIGGDGAGTSAKLAAEFGPENVERFHDAWNEAHDVLLAQGLPVKPTAHALLDALTARGIHHAVATSSGRESAEEKLKAAGLRERFDVVVTRQCVTNPKPDPEPFLTAARRLGVAPERCLAFEDSTPGLKAARAAGMTVVHVPDIAMAERHHAHHVARDLLSGAAMAGLRF